MSRTVIAIAVIIFLLQITLLFIVSRHYQEVEQSSEHWSHSSNKMDEVIFRLSRPDIYDYEFTRESLLRAFSADRDVILSLEEDLLKSNSKIVIFAIAICVLSCIQLIFIIRVMRNGKA